MKVIINRCYGGPGLSKEAAEECCKRGFETSTYFDSNNKTRTDPILVSVVEEFGEKANGMFAELKVIDIPFTSLDGWEIDDYDGMERIIHSGSWC